MAVKNNVPVVPCIIMGDSDRVGADGVTLQEYTPDETLPKKEAREKLKQQTEQFCRETFGIRHPPRV